MEEAKEIKSLVSIIIPTYNRKDMLKGLINSLLNQDYPSDKYEVIVSDDGSSDGTESLVSNFIKRYGDRIKYLKQLHKGTASARNKGASLAKGEILCFIDDDCVATRGLISSLITGLDYKPNIAGVGSKIIGTSNRFFACCHDFSRYYNSLGNKIEKRRFVCGSSMSIGKELFDLEGGFDESILTGEDEDLGLRLFKKGYSFLYFPKAVTFHNHGRDTFLLFLKHAWKWGLKGEVEIHLRHSKYSAYGKFAIKNRFFYLFGSPIISLFVSLKILLKYLNIDKKIFLYIPFIYLDKFVWCLATYKYLAGKNENS